MKNSFEFRSRIAAEFARRFPSLQTSSGHAGQPPVSQVPAPQAGRSDGLIRAVKRYCAALQESWSPSLKQEDPARPYVSMPARVDRQENYAPAAQLNTAYHPAAGNDSNRLTAAIRRRIDSAQQG